MKLKLKDLVPLALSERTNGSPKDYPSWMGLSIVAFDADDVKNGGAPWFIARMEDVGDDDLAKEIVRAVNSHTELVAALRFYADEKKWRSVETGIGDYPGDAMDYGATASAAIEKLEAS